MTHSASYQISRRSLLSMAAATTTVVALSRPADTAAAQNLLSGSAPGHDDDLGVQLLREWSQSPGTHRLVGDFRHAGYRLGSRTPKRRVVANVKRYGATGDGVTDDITAFRGAIRAAGEGGGGIVQIPPGTYHLSGPLFIHWSNVVLRGASTQQSVLYFSRPLREGYRDNWQDSQNQDRWSWAGGQFWVIPEQVKEQARSGGVARDRRLDPRLHPHRSPADRARQHRRRRHLDRGSDGGADGARRDREPPRPPPPRAPRG